MRTCWYSYQQGVTHPVCRVTVALVSPQLAELIKLSKKVGAILHRAASGIPDPIALILTLNQAFQMRYGNGVPEHTERFRDGHAHGCITVKERLVEFGQNLLRYSVWSRYRQEFEKICGFLPPKSVR